MINWYQNFVSSNPACISSSDQTNRTPATRWPVITRRMITDRIELHSVLLPLLIIIIIIITIIIIVVVVVVGHDTYYWVYLSSRVREWVNS